MSQAFGLANQNCSFAPQSSTVNNAYVTVRNVGDTSWTCPATRYYTITARGCGGTFGGGGGGGSAGASQRTELIRIGEIVTVSIARGGSGSSTTVTFPSGNVLTLTAGGNGPTGSPGAASGGDLNVAGNTGGGGSVGADAPAIGTFPVVSAVNVAFPPGPGAGGSTTAGGTVGGHGVVYIQGGKVPRIL